MALAEATPTACVPCVVCAMFIDASASVFDIFETFTFYTINARARMNIGS